MNAPRTGFGDLDLYPSFSEKAAVLAVRIAKNHPLMDGNKRLAWMSLRMFCALNEVSLVATADEAVAIMLRVAAGDEDEMSLARWITEHLES